MEPLNRCRQSTEPSGVEIKEFSRMLEITVLMALLAGFFLAPIVHWRIRRTKCCGVRTIIAGLVFAPGLCVTALSVWFYITIDYEVNRWTLVYVLQGVGALRCLAAISGITATYLGVCLLLECFPRRALRDGEGGAVRVIGVWRTLVAIQLALMAITAYLYYYNSLGYAVSSGDLALAEKRLNWNLEGLGPNNGLIIRVGTPGLVRYPLLPVAVKNSNYDMVKILVKHGADLNPKDWDEQLHLSIGRYYKNTLYFAVRNHDVEMIDFLIDLGVSPEQGIHPALSERDRELLNFFLEEGASLEFALGVAERMGYSQQKIEGLFPETIPRNQVEAGQ